jgi:hypothetical protein
MDAEKQQHLAGSSGARAWKRTRGALQLLARCTARPLPEALDCSLGQPFTSNVLLLLMPASRGMTGVEENEFSRVGDLDARQQPGSAVGSSRSVAPMPQSLWPHSYGHSHGVVVRRQSTDEVTFGACFTTKYWRPLTVTKPCSAGDELWCLVKR